MIGEAVEEHRDLAREIARRGHEAGAYGLTWTAFYDLSPEAEMAFIRHRPIPSSASHAESGRLECFFMRGNIIFKIFRAPTPVVEDRDINV